MATQVENKSSTATAAVSRVDQYVGRQLAKTTQQVKLSDIMTGVIAMAVFVITFFLVTAIIDAWIWAFTPTARLLLLAIFMAGMAMIGWYFILPFFVRRINPEYAARMIEEAKPEFKNSLLNYLSLKSRKKATHRAILNEISKKAATDLSTISPDAAVDKSNLIKIGFVLVALSAISVSYFILSPKNPWPTVLRILSPGSKIAKPAAVLIVDVQPGDASVFFGDKLEVSAKVSGVSEDQPVKIVYSTKDEQIVDATISMNAAEIGGIYSAILDTGPTGIQQSLTYRIEAGDGISPTYSINVRPNPTISIEQIKITPPRYTNLNERIVEGNGEIQAVEGSKVEITAKANLPIELAYIVPLVARNNSSDKTDFRELRTIQMRANQTTAVGRMVAALNSNRDRAQFTHYKINFRSKDAHRNEHPNIYPVRVIADLAPEIQFVQPNQTEITVPVNQSLPIQLWAADLDYEISSIDLQIDHEGQKIFSKNLFKRSAPQNAGDRITANILLTPESLGLRPGDKAILFASAADNRVSASSELPDPNVTRTENYTLRVTDPVQQEEKDNDPEQDSADQNSGPNDDSNDDPNENPENGDSSNNDQESRDSESNGQDSGSDNESGNSSSDQGDTQDGSKDQENPGNSSDGNQDNDGDNSDQQNDQTGDQQSENEADVGSDSSTDQQSNDEKTGSQQDESGSDSGAQSAGNQDEESESSQPNAGDPTSEQQPQNSGTQSSDAASDSSPNAGGQDSDDAAESGETDSGNNSNGSSDDPSSGQQRSGSEAGNVAGDPNDQSDGTSNSNDGTRRDGSAQDGSQQQFDGSSGDPAATDQEGTRDRNLEDGEVEPLRENASDSEMMERLKEYFGDKTDPNASNKDKTTRKRQAEGDDSLSQNPRDTNPDDNQSADNSNPNPDSNKQNSQNQSDPRSPRNDSAQQKDKQKQKQKHDTNVDPSQAELTKNEEDGFRQARPETDQPEDNANGNGNGDNGSGGGKGIAADDLPVVQKYDLYDLLVDPKYDPDEAIKFLQKLAAEKIFDEKDK